MLVCRALRARERKDGQSAICYDPTWRAQSSVDARQRVPRKFHYATTPTITRLSHGVRLHLHKPPGVFAWRTVLTQPHAAGCSAIVTGKGVHSAIWEPPMGTHWFEEGALSHACMRACTTTYIIQYNQSGLCCLSVRVLDRRWWTPVGSLWLRSTYLSGMWWQHASWGGRGQ